jgi:hypothetical protein
MDFCGFSVTLMLTTAGPVSATRPEKSGSPVTRAETGAGEVGTAIAVGAAGGVPTSALDRWWTTTMKAAATTARDQVLMLPIELILCEHVDEMRQTGMVGHRFQISRFESK